VWIGLFPNFVDATPSRQTAHVRRLLTEGADLWVPGHGSGAGAPEPAASGLLESGAGARDAVRRIPAADAAQLATPASLGSGGIHDDYYAVVSHPGTGARNVKTQRQAPSLLALLGLAISVPARLPAQESITADRIARHIEVLAHDSLRGRATPSPGLDAAARYVAAELRRAGLRPAQGTDLVVRWPLVTRQRIAGEIRVVGTAGDDVLVYGTDFAVMAAGIPEVEGQLVPDADLRDSAAIRGRIPLLRLSGDDWHGSAHAAARVARRAGALAVVLVLDSAQAVAPVAAVGIQMDHSATAAPAVLVTPAAARRLLAGKSPAAVSIRIPERADTALVPYVLGVLPGRDARLRDEYVVVSAHLDHLGVGTPDERGDSLYNGADDNASGVAALVEMARARGSPRAPAARCSSSPRPRLCLCGSEFFTRQPSPPLSALVADLNLDGIRTELASRTRCPPRAMSTRPGTHGAGGGGGHRAPADGGGRSVARPQVTSSPRTRSGSPGGGPASSSPAPARPATTVRATKPPPSNQRHASPGLPPGLSGDRGRPRPASLGARGARSWHCHAEALALAPCRPTGRTVSYRYPAPAQCLSQVVRAGCDP
jgi:hypothetical protein